MTIMLQRREESSLVAMGAALDVDYEEDAAATPAKEERYDAFRLRLFPEWVCTG